jgi:hypothetical protein
MKKYGTNSHEAKGFLELYKDGNFQKIKFFHRKRHRREIMDAWRKEIRNLHGVFHFIIKLDE